MHAPPTPKLTLLHVRRHLKAVYHPASAWVLALLLMLGASLGVPSLVEVAAATTVAVDQDAWLKEAAPHDRSSAHLLRTVVALGARNTTVASKEKLGVVLTSNGVRTTTYLKRYISVSDEITF